jgi:acyl-coenzyme A thioesterase PaaI-like protein
LPPDCHRGLQGGGGTGAINGGVIAAGFDAVAVLTGLGHYETDTVVTVDLSVQFLALAEAGPAGRLARLGHPHRTQPVLRPGRAQRRRPDPTHTAHALVKPA